MVRHLNEDALVDLAENGQRHPHADGCETCGQRVRDLREALAAAREVVVPEPSPLFWDRLSAKVRDRIAAPQPGGRVERAGVSAVLRRFAYAALAIAIVTAAAWRIEFARRGQTLAPARTSVSGDVRGSAADAVEPTGDEASWELVTDAAAAVDLDTATEAAGVSLQPGTAERAALQMSPDEQRELVRLLQAALDQPE